eukprot:COSAG03_NODE_14980_length_415_cov_0.563584_1_plen_58_part_10
MKEGELAFGCGAAHAVKQLQQRAELVGAAPLAVACGEEAGALRCVSTPAPCQLSARMC